MTKEVLKKKKKKIPFKYLVMFQPGQRANIPSRMKQPHGHKRHWQRRYKNTMTPPRSSAASKDNQKENRQSPWELATGHRILAASEVQPSFLFGHMLAAPPTRQVPSQVLRTRNRADKKAMANPGRVRSANQWVPESKVTSRSTEI